MKKLIFAAATLLTLNAGPLFAQSPEVDALAKKACRAEVARYDLEIVKNKSIIAEAEVNDPRSMNEFVYPAVVDIVTNFTGSIQRVEGMLSPDFLETAAQYNRLASEIRSNTSYPRTIKEPMVWELDKTYGEKTRNLIKRDMVSLGQGWANGNWIQLGSDLNGWGVYYSPTQVTKAGTIKYMATMDNERIVGKDFSKRVTVRLELRYDPFTKRFIGLPETMDPAGIDKMFEEATKSGGDVQTSVFLFSKTQVVKAKDRIQFLEGIETYKACKELIK